MLHEHDDQGVGCIPELTIGLPAAVGHTASKALGPPGAVLFRIARAMRCMPRQPRRHCWTQICFCAPHSCTSSFSWRSRQPWGLAYKPARVKCIAPHLLPCTPHAGTDRLRGRVSHRGPQYVHHSPATMPCPRRPRQPGRHGCTRGCAACAACPRLSMARCRTCRTVSCIRWQRRICCRNASAGGLALAAVQPASGTVWGTAHESLQQAQPLQLRQLSALVLCGCPPCVAV